MKKKSLKPYNSFGLDVEAKDIVVINSIEEAITTLEQINKKAESHLILGGGSNILFTKDFNGIVLLNRISGIETVEEDDNHVHLKVGAGENWHSFVQRTIELNLGGIENLSLIPGCVGASPMQNIGAYGVEVKDVITKVYAVKIDTLKTVQFSNSECEFAYRSSIFKTSHKNQYFITHVEFKLTKNHEFKTQYGAIKAELEKNGISHDKLSIKAISEAVISIRESKLPNPKEIGNAGSFFKNPVISETQFKSLQKAYPDIPFYTVDGGIKLAAGWLIEKAGWKGFTNGDFGVHKKQALVLVNYKNAKGNDIYQLSKDIIEDIQSKFNVALEREVNIL